MAPAQHPGPAAAAAPAPVLTCHNTVSRANHPVTPGTRETAPRGLMRGLRALIAISRCDPMPIPHAHKMLTSSDDLDIMTDVLLRGLGRVAEQGEPTVRQHAKGFLRDWIRSESVEQGSIADALGPGVTPTFCYYSPQHVRGSHLLFAIIAHKGGIRFSSSLLLPSWLAARSFSWLAASAASAWASSSPACRRSADRRIHPWFPPPSGIRDRDRGRDRDRDRWI